MSRPPLSAADLRQLVETCFAPEVIDEPTFRAIFASVRAASRTLRRVQNPLLDVEGMTASALIVAAIAVSRHATGAKLQDFLIAASSLWDVAGAILPEIAKEDL